MPKTVDPATEALVNEVTSDITKILEPVEHVKPVKTEEVAPTKKSALELKVEELEAALKKKIEITDFVHDKNLVLERKVEVLTDQVEVAKHKLATLANVKTPQGDCVVLGGKVYPIAESGRMIEIYERFRKNFVENDQIVVVLPR